MLNPLKKIHPSFRPILFGALLFAAFNIVVTTGITFSSFNSKFNFHYGNFLPTKLDLMHQNNPKQLDVLFLGTSQTNNGFLTSSFEQASKTSVNSFNLGLPNNRYDLMEAYLESHIQRYGHPKLVMVELSPSILETSSYYYYLPALYYRTLIEQNPELTAQYLSHPHLAWNVKEELLLSGMSSFHQFRYSFSPLNILNKVTGKLSQLASKPKSSDEIETAEASNAFPITPDMTQKGWFPKEQSPEMKTPEGIKASVLEAKKYYFDHQPDVHFEKLQLLLAYCKQEHIPVVLVSWPNHPAFLKLFKNSTLKQHYDKGLQALLKETPTPLIDLNQELGHVEAHYEEDTLFSDPRHLTPSGAHLFSQILAQKLFQLPQIQRQFLANKTNP